MHAYLFGGMHEIKSILCFGLFDFQLCVDGKSLKVRVEYQESSSFESLVLRLGLNVPKI